MTQAEAPTSQLDMNLRTQFMVGIPIGLKLALEDASKERSVAVSTIVRNALASAVGYQLPAETQRANTSKLSDAEKKARQQAKNKERRDMIKDALAEFRKARAGNAEPEVEEA
jgi:hypothetical protein